MEEEIVSSVCNNSDHLTKNMFMVELARVV